MMHKTPLALALILATLVVQAGPLEQARTDLDAGHWRAAEVALKGTLQQDPKNAQARQILGELELARHDGAAAEVALKEALRQGGDAGRILPALGMALLYQGQAGRVLAEIAVPPGAAPGLAAEVLAVRGLALVERGELDAAEDALRESLAGRPGGLRATLGLARLAARRGQIDEARRLVEELFKAAPATREALELQADLEIAAERPQAALAAVDRARKLAPESLPLLLLQTQLRLDTGDADGAQSNLEALTAQAPQLPTLTLLAGRLDLARGRGPQALRSFASYLVSQPKDPLALYLAAATAYALDEPGRARELAERLIELAPASPKGNALLAAILTDAGDTAGAQARLAAIAPGQEPPETEQVRLRMALAEGRLDAAQAMADRLIAAAQDPWEPRLLRARILAARQDWAAAAGEAAALAGERPERAEPAALHASALLANGDPAGALAAARASVERSPEAPAAHLILGSVLAQGGDQAGARAAFAEAQRLDPKSAQAATGLAQVEAAAGDLAAARASLDRLAAAAPDAPGAAIGLAALDLKEGRNADARARLEQALARSPQDLDLRLSLAAAVQRNGDTLGALRVVQDTPADQADRPLVLRARGELELAASQPAQAVATFERLNGLRPKEPDAAWLLIKARVEAGQLVGIETAALNALALGESPLLPATLELVYRRLPDNAARGRLLAALGGAIPDHPAYRALAADLAIAQENNALAITHLQAARRAAPDAEPVYRRLNALLIAAGRLNEAHELIADRVARHPDDRTARLKLAEVALRQGCESEAVAIYRELLKRGPDQPEALNNLAMLTLERDPDGAIALAERAVVLSPNDWRMLDTLALALLRKGRAADAVRALTPARQVDPGNPTLSFRLARALADTGETQRAKRLLLEIGQRSFPERAEADALLAELMQAGAPQ